MSSATAQDTTAMSAPTDPVAALNDKPDDAKSHQNPSRSIWRKILTGILILALLVAIVVVIFLTSDNSQGDSFGAENPGPNGSQALIRVLEDQQITVHQARNVNELEHQLEFTPQATVVLVDGAGFLERSPAEQERRVRDAIPANQLILASSHSGFINRFTDGALYVVEDFEAVEPVPARSETSAQCTHDAASTAAQRIMFSSGSILSSEDPAYLLCFGPPENIFPHQDDFQRDSYGVLAYHTQTGLTVLGAPEILTNSAISDEGNAALSLWLAGKNADLIWYNSDASEVLDPTEPTGDEALPPWVRYGFWWSLVVFAVIAVWLGRRHGPVVVEPLPSQVKPAEITVGRARMHERGRHTTQALEALQQATLRRLAQILRTGTVADDRTIIYSVAKTLQVPVSTIQEIFAQPGSEGVSGTELVERGQALLALEDRVREALRTPE